MCPRIVASGVPVVSGRARDLDRDFHSDVVVGGSLVQLDLFNDLLLEYANTLVCAGIGIYLQLACKY